MIAPAATIPGQGRRSVERLALIALLCGATGIGFAPILVRLSETGPISTAFYRLFFALPVLWIWMELTKPDPARAETAGAAPQLGEIVPSPRLPARASAFWLFGAAGFFFAGDMAFWHWSIQLTTVANSTLLTNFAPFFVMLGARFLFFERITPALVFGLILAFGGGAMLVGASVQLSIEHVWGDLLALVAALFYAGYLLTVKFLRRHFSTATIMARSALVSAPILGLIALASGDSFRILSLQGWAVLLMLALISHAGGQSLIAYALAHLKAAFSSVSLLLQPVVAAILAWIILSEPLAALQVLGGLIILAGIFTASRGK
jgi:drug/metabolite transporter (DMT)-like permease